VNKLIEKYDNIVIRTLIQLVPFGIGSGIDVALKSKIETIRNNRNKIFFDELSNGKIKLTEEMLLNDDFLHSFFSTYSYAKNSRRNEKIKWFAKLLRTGIIEKNIDFDVYDEYLRVLDNLSIRDMYILRKIESFEKKFNNSRVLKQGQKFPDPFDIMPDWHCEVMDSIVDEFSISEEEFKGFIQRLISFGLFERVLEIREHKSLIDTSDITGRLTTNYYNLIKIIK